MTVDHFMRALAGTKGEIVASASFCRVRARMGPWEWPRFRPTAA